MNKIADYAEVFEGEDELFYVHTKSNNGQVITSSEGYLNHQDAYDVALDTGLPIKKKENDG